MFHIKQEVSNFLCYLFLVNHLVAVIYYLRYKPLQSMLWTTYIPFIMVWCVLMSHEIICFIWYKCGNFPKISAFYELYVIFAVI